DSRAGIPIQLDNTISTYLIYGTLCRHPIRSVMPRLDIVNRPAGKKLWQVGRYQRIVVYFVYTVIGSKKDIPPIPESPVWYNVFITARELHFFHPTIADTIQFPAT